MISDALETVIIKRVEVGYKLTGNDGVSIAVYRNWDLIEQMFRKADFSTEYIEMRKAEVNRGGEQKLTRPTNSYVRPLLQPRRQTAHCGRLQGG
jgi:hypothetical protein